MSCFAARASAFVAGVLVIAAPLAARQDAGPFDAVFAQYAAGDGRVFPQHFATEAAFRALRGELFQKTRDWRQTWTPAGPTFMLELAAWGLERSWVDSAVVLRTAGDIVVRRTAPLGTIASQDRFEIEFHRAALSLLSGQKLFSEAERYIDMVKSRVSPVAVPGESRLVDPRLALTRAFLVDLTTAPGLAGVEDTAWRPGAEGVETPALPGALRQALERAAAAYAPLLDMAVVADEAHVRRAFALGRLGQPAAALVELAAVKDSADDPGLQYWKHLFAGRALDALGRQEDAGASFERAAALFPGSQTSALALAVWFQRTGDPRQAQRWAVQARTTGRSGRDPWLDYWGGDLRFFPARVATLRQVQP